MRGTGRKTEGLAGGDIGLFRLDRRGGGIGVGEGGASTNTKSSSSESEMLLRCCSWLC